jgi:sugar transferase (PEP-CTERM system associated)
MIRLFRVFVPASVVALLVSEFILIYACYLAAAFLVFRVDPQVFLVDDNGWLRIAVVVICLILAVYFHDLYAHFRVKSRVLLYQQVGVVVGAAFLIQSLLAYARLRALILPTWLMIAGSALTMVSLPAWRIFYGRFALKMLASERVLFLGASPVIEEIMRYLAEHPETGLASVGYVDDQPDAGVRVGGSQWLGSIAELRQVVAQSKPQRIVVGLSERRQRLPVNELLEMRLSGIHIEDALSTYEATFGRISTRELRPSQLIFSSTEFGPNPRRVLLQALYSTAIAVLATVLTAPIMLLAAILVKLSSPGPALFRQDRVGKDNRIFTLYKFRSMYTNAEASSGAVWAKPDDPRVTPVGKWLRKLRLDELPQLLNVLRGDMSIVGPRPERPEFVKELTERIPYYRQRHCVKPGITGWAQINHNYGGTVEDTIIKLEYDLYYIKNLAPALDAFIMFHTAKVMLLSRGAQ